MTGDGNPRSCRGGQPSGLGSAVKFSGFAMLMLLGCGRLAEAQAADSLAHLSSAIRDLTNRISPAVVQILVTGYDTVEDEKGQVATQISRRSSSGSGIIVDSSGYIMTNAHVVQGAIRIRLQIPANRTTGKLDVAARRMHTVDARVLGVDRDSDLALIRVDESGLPALRFGDSDQLRQGDLVFAVGSPMGLQNSVSMGVVSAARRAVSDDNPILYIQTDASINPGNSGGALVDTNGLLVGMNTFIVSRSGGNEGIGFAIPSNVVRSVYEEIRQRGRVSRGTVGAFVQNITPVLAKALGLPLESGVVVADVKPNGPAEAAGLKRRDIILSLDERAIETARQFTSDIYRRERGDVIHLVVQRGEQRIDASVPVEEHKEPWDPLAALASPEKNLVQRLGILCIEIDKSIAELMPDLRRAYGVIVAAKAPEGQAEFIDVQPGDVIHSVNNIPIATLAAFRQIINGFQHGDAVALQVERDGRLQYVAFEIE
jgi:serine protease Do